MGHNETMWFLQGNKTSKQEPTHSFTINRKKASTALFKKETTTIKQQFIIVCRKSLTSELYLKTKMN
jgi:hypothetical protein